MPTLVATAGPYTLSADYPDAWIYSPSPVPNLVVPRQLFSLSNRILGSVAAGSSPPRPPVASLGASGLCLWGVCQLPHDPSPDTDDPLPDYPALTGPLDYFGAAAEPSYGAREWSASQFLRRRIGFIYRSARVTVWAWEGTASTPADVDIARSIVASVRVS